MKLLSVFLVALVAAAVKTEVTPEQRAKFMGWSDACKQETGVTEEMVTNALNGEFSDDPKFKEHVLCIVKKTGSLDENGKYQQDELKSHMIMAFGDETKAQAVIDECFQETATPESAFESAKCFYKEYKNM